MRLSLTRLAFWSILLTVLSVAGSTSVRADLRLVEAVKNRDAQAVRALLKQNVDVNELQAGGVTALHWAAHRDDLEIADLLLQAGAQVNVADDHGVTPLVLAATNGSSALVTRLLAAGANPNTAISTGETVLMTAARTGKLEAVRALLARGANVNAKESANGQTALMWAAAEGHLEVVRALAELGADVHARSTTDYGFAPIHFAAREGNMEIVKALLAAGSDVNEQATDGTTPLLAAVVRGHIDLARYLLDQGADPNADFAGYTPLHWAAGTWETPLTGEERGIKPPEASEWSAMDGLHGPEKLEMIKLLIDRGANPNARPTRNIPRFGGGGGPNLAGGTAFLAAATAVDIPVMRLLVERGADPNLTTNAGVTALMVAAGFNRPEDTRFRRLTFDAVKYLVEELGADVHAVNNQGENALFAAAQEAMDSVVQYLADKGVDLNLKNHRGWTALTYADGYYANATYQINHSTAELLRKLGAAHVVLDCSVAADNDDAYQCAAQSTTRQSPEAPNR